MGKTVQVAQDRAFDASKTVLPAEVARGVYIENPPGAQALKVMHLMISTAGGRMADDVQHQFRLSDIRKIPGMKHHDQDSLAQMFRELRAAVLTYDDTERKRLIIGGLLDEALVDYRDEVSGDLLVTWYFGRTFRRMAEESNHWAILDRQTVSLCRASMPFCYFSTSPAWRICSVSIIGRSQSLNCGPCSAFLLTSWNGSQT